MPDLQLSALRAAASIRMIFDLIGSAMAFLLVGLVGVGINCGRLSQGPEAATERELRVFAAALYAYSVGAGRLPSDYPAAVREVIRDPAGERVRRDFPDAVRGVDAWGRALIYERVNDRRAKLRSVGKNGVDEHGAGDDIEKIVDLGLMSQRRVKGITRRTKGGANECHSPNLSAGRPVHVSGAFAKYLHYYEDRQLFCAFGTLLIRYDGIIGCSNSAVLKIQISKEL